MGRSRQLRPVFLALVGILAPAHGPFAQEVIMDPEETINDYVSVGEFRVDGDLEGWGQNAINLSVANGVLDVTTTGGDPHFFRTGIIGAEDDHTIVEFRLRIIEAVGQGWELFWGDTAGGGFSAGRRFPHTMSIADTEFHIVQYHLESILGGAPTDIRIDPGNGPGTRVEVDYARVGRISPDEDEDGLPDRVETGTGIFFDARDTGSDPTLADTDEDGFDDGVEVAAGTDPNDPDDAPVPTLAGYTRTQTVYIVDVPIEDNLPAVTHGVPELFEIDPALPAGLSLDPMNGRISGTPAEASPASDYVVSVQFEGGASSELSIRLEVRLPFIEYAVAKRTLIVDENIVPFRPQAVGTQPESFSIEPDLPDGVDMDPDTGEIFGIPFEYSPVTEYTVFAAYDAFPETTTLLTLSALRRPVVTFDAEEIDEDYESLGEFEVDFDFEGWNPNERIAPLVVEDGLLVVETIGDDPFLSKAFSFERDCRILNLLVSVRAGFQPWEIFWAEDAPGRGNFGAPGQPLTVSEVGLAFDDEFYSYQIDFTESLEGRLLAVRLDPGQGAGNILDIDYIRLGCGESEPPPPPEPTFKRGDADGSGSLEVTDAINNLAYQFLGNFAAPCLDALDFDDSGRLEVTDAVGVLSFQFLGLAPPPAPGSETCGTDPTADALDCTAYPEGSCE